MFRSSTFRIVHTPISDGNPYQKELAEALRRSGHYVDLYTPVWPFPLIKYIRDNGKPDIFHMHWIHPFLVRKTILGSLIRSTLSLLEIALVRILGIKIVWTVHNVLNHERIQPETEKFFLRIIPEFFNKIIFLSEASIDSFNDIVCPSKRVRDKYHIVPHGYYIGSYANRISRSIARQVLDIDNDSFVLLCFGEVRPYKGLEMMIDLMEKTPDPNVRLIIAGRACNNSYEKAIKEAASFDKRILTFLGYIPDRFVQVFMNASDIVVLPYRDILNSGAAVLAMSFGKPIIAPDLGSMKELVDKNGGILFDPADKKTLADALAKLKNADLQAMGKHNFKKIRHHDWDRISGMTSEIYNKVMGVCS